MKSTNRRSLLFAAVLFVLTTVSLFPCSSMSYRFRSGTYVGKNYDFSFGDGMLLTNKRNVKKMGLISRPEYMKYGAQWTSKYGSITFNQFGRELPSGGMNEEGLVVELMWLLGTTYGEVRDLPSVNELQWIQYQLDRYGSTHDVIANIEKLQVIAAASTLHYLVCDSTNDCAVVEMTDGRAIVLQGADLPDRVLTNTPYSLTRSGAYPAGLSSQEMVYWHESYRRFQTLKKHLTTGGLSEDPIRFALQGLDSVKARVPWYQRVRLFFTGKDPGTQWQIVYDTAEKEIHFRTRKNPELRTVKINRFSYSCRSPVNILDLNEGKAGDVSDSFHPYRRKDNERIIRKSQVEFERTPRRLTEFLIDLPEKFICGEQPSE